MEYDKGKDETLQVCNYTTNCGTTDDDVHYICDGLPGFQCSETNDCTAKLPLQCMDW